MTDLSGSLALVTGGAKRIGRSLCIAIAEAGADVVVHYHGSKEEARQVAEDVRDRGRQAWTIQADLADPAAAEGLLDAASALAGRRIDLLVNNASAFPERRLAEATYDDLDAMMRLHAWAPLVLTRSLAAGGPGAVVNLLDTRVASVDPNHFPYHLSKQALWNLTRTLAVALAPDVRVNAVAPGPILPASTAEQGSMKAAIAATLLGRAGTSKEVAEAVVYLLGAQYVTGQTLWVDGGRHLR